MISPRALPRPGPRWGTYPQRLKETAARSSDAPTSLGIAGRLSPWCPAPSLLWLHRHWLELVSAHVTRWRPLEIGTSAWQTAVLDLKRQLRGDGFSPSTLAQALGAVTVVIERTSGWTLYPQQQLAAALMLDQRLVEMATGEGKTLAMGAAAAVAALAGVPTHVITANDYLAERDVQALKGLWHALGLTAAHVDASQDVDTRRQAHGADVVYSTAKDIAFDYLRDLLGPSAGGPATPVLRGLNLALLDEADSILLDEAVVPLIISSALQEHPRQLAQRRAVWWQARSLALQLDPQAHARPDPTGLRMVMTDAGEEALSIACRGLPGIWQRPRLRKELVTHALTTHHMLLRDVHYLVRDGRIELLDAITGRVATGRVMSQGLHALLELKEGLPPSAPSETMAQITFQRFFQRYWRLAGISGTLWEARDELHQIYGLSVVRMPTHHPSQRRQWPLQCFRSSQERWHAVAMRARAMQEQGRPMLVGTDSVDDSEQLSAILSHHAIPHVVLNARHDRQEAAIIAQAGRAGAVTVATRMAGRGTDITLDAAALRAGGLHVVVCQRNESRRMDRQLLGRCARHGQPGSAETWICAANSGESPALKTPKLQRCSSGVIPSSSWLSARWHQALARAAQWLEEKRQAGMRRHLLDQDRQWEAQHRRLRRTIV